MTGFALLTLAAIFATRNIGVPRWTAARQAAADLFGFLEEHLAATEDLRANGATGYILNRLHAQSRNLLRRQRQASLYGATSWATTTFLLALNTALALALGAWLFQQGSITLGTVYLIFSYTQLLVRPVEQISRQFQDLQQATASMGRVSALLALQPTIRDGPGAPLAAGPLGVAFQDVTFGYQADEPVLRDLSFAVPPGAVLGVLGRTGSGKTTLTRLLFRLYDPADGAIALGGTDLRTLHLGDLRRAVGLVTQDIQLFHASVRDNLTFFDRTIPDARILEVLHELGLSTWYATLPGGLDTRLAPGGGGLSAGEAQLVAFARVFLRDPGLVILDEASSRLDPATEQQMERAVDRLLRGRTAIIIAHRLHTIGRADDILILDDGGSAEYGARDRLARDPGSRFAALLRTGLEEVLA
jgi:ATP-binding cassette subfamily B protein